MTASAPTGTLEGWTRRPFAAEGLEHDVYERGTGPGVVLIPELPGLTPEVLGLADHLVGSGFTVVVPSPFGVPGRAATPGYTMSTLARLCVAAEFRAFATDVRRPVTDWIRAVARDLAARTPGGGVGVIGMCFTGGFALAAAIDESVLAAVAGQPAVPFPVGRTRSADPGMSAADLDRLAARASAGAVCTMGLRFSEDGAAPRARFAALRTRLGEAFEVIEIDSSPGNPGGFSKGAHSVLTNEVRNGNEAAAARDRVVAFLHDRLGA